MVARGRGRGDGDLLFNGCRVLAMRDEYAMEICLDLVILSFALTGVLREYTSCEVFLVQS